MKTLLETLKYYNLRMKIKQLIIFTILNHVFENIYTIIIIIIIIIKTQQKSCFQRNIVEKKNYINTLFAGVGHYVLRITVSLILDLEYGRRLQAEGCTQDRGHRFSQ